MGEAATKYTKRTTNINIRYSSTTEDIIGCWIWQCPTCSKDHRCLHKQDLNDLDCTKCGRKWKKVSRTEYEPIANVGPRLRLLIE